jgi:hypothetical protein
MYTSIPEFAAQAIYRLGYELDGPGFESRQEEDMFFFSKTSKQAVVQTAHNSMGTGIFFWG